MLLGNDVVDLQAARALQKSKDARFTQRVFTKAELACIGESKDPEWALWMIWAAKESAFKLLVKLNGPSVFAHAAFAVQNLKSLGKQSNALEGSLQIQGKIFSLRWESTQDYVHCIAQQGAGSVYSRVELGNAVEATSFTSFEEESIHSEESRQVRSLVKRMLREKHKADFEIVKLAHSPPTLRREGLKVSDIDLSLSHDGRFVAAAITL